MQDIRTITENILLEIGANPKCKGFAYTVTAMEVMNEDIECVNYLTRLYTEIACRHKTTYIRVERSIRYIKEKIAVSGNLKNIDKYFPAIGMKFTNSEFLGTLYIKINKILREGESNAN